MRQNAVVCICDRCGKRETIVFNESPNAEIRQRGWRGFHTNLDLCPDCAKIYEKINNDFWGEKNK